MAKHVVRQVRQARHERCHPQAGLDELDSRRQTVITTKATYDVKQLPDDLAVAGHQINFMPGQNGVYPAYKSLRTRVTAFWSTSAAMGPEPLVALMNAIHRDDERKVDEIWEDMHRVPPMVPPGEFSHFPEYNAQVEKVRFNAASYVNAGPSRAPYRDLPDY
ncbi:MAG: hypothetical protein GEU73_00870 [Chloroflexi bacterium]|nr:hypothetical protein [Chloroflexota bacterium]